MSSISQSIRNLVNKLLPTNLPIPHLLHSLQNPLQTVRPHAGRMHLQLSLLQQLSCQLPEHDAELKVLFTRRSAVVGQGLPGGSVRQSTLTLYILSWAFDWLKGAVDATGSGKGVGTRLGTRIDGDSVHGVF